MKHLIGNRSAREMLLRLIEAKRVPNALLFAGPEGVGKKQFAIELARSFVCPHPVDRIACGSCAACNRAGEFAIPVFDKGEESDFVFFSQHPDVGMVVPFRRNLRVGAIRALERESHFQPFEGSSRVFIVDDAEKMTEHASNALLKTLEEPSPTSHIILIASRADRLLPTIRSRCQIIRFAPVGVDEIEPFLVETGQFSRDDASLIARVCGGSVARALNIVPASFRTQRSLMLEMLKAAASGDRRVLLAASEEMNDARNKGDFEENLAVLRGLIHDTWLLRNGVSDILNSDLVNELTLLSTTFDAGDLVEWLAEIQATQENFVVNINRRIATDALAMKMAG